MVFREDHKKIRTRFNAPIVLVMAELPVSTDSSELTLGSWAAS